MPKDEQEERMEKAVLEVRKDNEKFFILYLLKSLENMKSVAGSIDIGSPINLEDVFEMMKVLKEDSIKKYPRKIFACIQNTDEKENPIYQYLQIQVGTYKVWISKSGTQINICVGGRD